MSRECKLFLSFLIGFLLPFVVFFVLTSIAHSAPFLVCDPQPNHITHYMVNMDGTETEVPAQDLGDGTVRLHYDLAGLSEGQHHVEVRAKNVWGVSDPAPFDFTKSSPVLPTGFSISAE